MIRSLAALVVSFSLVSSQAAPSFASALAELEAAAQGNSSAVIDGAERRDAKAQLVNHEQHLDSYIKFGDYEDALATGHYKWGLSGCKSVLGCAGQAIASPLAGLGLGAFYRANTSHEAGDKMGGAIPGLILGFFGAVFGAVEGLIKGVFNIFHDIDAAAHKDNWT